MLDAFDFVNKYKIDRFPPFETYQILPNHKYYYRVAKKYGG